MIDLHLSKYAKEYVAVNEFGSKWIVYVHNKSSNGIKLALNLKLLETNQNYLGNSSYQRKTISFKGRKYI